jgi:thiamine biosynthesis lipoprotein
MRSCSPTPSIERAQPLLGTTVRIRVDAADPAVAHRAIDAAFAAVGRVHALMSFHAADSDLSRLHAARAGERVAVDALTARVLREALLLSERSRGAFDPTVAAQLVAWGLLPAPRGSRPPDAGASWQDIEVDDEDRVCLRRPLWIDLGGIAKGHAVDCAVHVLRLHGIQQGCVNAGGDLRTLGPGPHRVAIASDEAEPSHQAVLELGEAAVATSSGRVFSASGVGPHVDGRSRACMALHETVTVVAERCIHADALTKIVLALGTQSAAILESFQATAYLQDAAGHWTPLNTAT